MLIPSLTYLLTYVSLGLYEMKNLVLSAIKHGLQIVYLRRIKHEAIILYTENVIRYTYTYAYRTH